MKENQTWKIRIALTIDRGGNMVDVVNFTAIETIEDGRKFAYMQQCRAGDLRSWDADTVEDFEHYMFARLAAIVDNAARGVRIPK